MRGDIVSERSNLPALKNQHVVALPPAPALRDDIKKPMRWAMLILFLFFGFGGAWAATARLAGAVIATGVVSPESRRQTIQHLEGGIIRSVAVREGDRVKAGDELMVLQDIDAKADSGTQKARLITLAAQEARGEAERNKLDTIQFTHPVLADRTNPIVKEATEQQVARFEARKAGVANKQTILQERISQLTNQIAGLSKQLEGVRKQIELLTQEATTVEEMVKKGYDRLPRLLGLQRALAQQYGAEGEYMANIARAKDSISEMNLQIANIDTQRMEEVETELADTRSKKAELEEQMHKSTDRLTRTVIRAPSAGIVLNVKYKTAGGVVRPGEPILDIVPTEERLIIEARLSPRDIDDVHAGLEAYVIFPSFPQRRLHRITGRVIQVSADAITDDKSGERFFNVRVEVDREVLKVAAPNIELSPGLPAEIYIGTVERTVLAYLMQPLELAFERSMREH